MMNMRVMKINKKTYLVPSECIQPSLLEALRKIRLTREGDIIEMSHDEHIAFLGMRNHPYTMEV